MSRNPQSLVYEIIGKNLFSIRKKIKKTQEEFANSVGMNRTSLALIENGKQKITIEKLYELLIKWNIELNEVLPSKDELEQQLGNESEIELIDKKDLKASEQIDLRKAMENRTDYES